MAKPHKHPAAVKRAGAAVTRTQVILGSLAPRLQRGSNSRRACIAWSYGPRSAMDGIPTQGVGTSTVRR
jgi:hypothetical protein